MATDYVGCRVVEYLVGRGEPIEFLVLDPADRGGFNRQMETIWAERKAPGCLLYAPELTDDACLDRLEASRPAIGILAWWPYILKDRLLGLPARGWLNFHPSYLPYNRGKHPNFWCLADGTPCGVTLHFIDAGVDTGAVVAQEELPVGWEDTGETVYYKSREAIIDLFRRCYDDILAGRLAPIAQVQSEGSFHRAREIDAASQIDLDASSSARRLLNLIRARMFNGHPTAFFEEDGKRYAVRVSITELPPGE